MACHWDCGSVVICLCFTSFFLGLTVLMPVMVALFASPSGPSISINLFHNNQPLNINFTRANGASPMNMSIHFDLKLKNENAAIGLHYPDPLKITFSYFPNVSMMVFLAEYELDSFYQGNGKTRHMREMVETSGFPTVLEGTDMVAFRVDLVGSYRYKKAGTKRHKMDVGCVVVVNDATGLKMQTGFIDLVIPGLDSQLEPPSNDDYYGGY